MTAFATASYRRTAAGLRGETPDNAHPALPGVLLRCETCGAQPGRYAAVCLNPPTAWCASCWETTERAKFAEGAQ